MTQHITAYITNGVHTVPYIGEEALAPIAQVAGESPYMKPTRGPLR